MPLLRVRVRVVTFVKVFVKKSAEKGVRKRVRKRDRKRDIKRDRKRDRKRGKEGSQREEGQQEQGQQTNEGREGPIIDSNQGKSRSKNRGKYSPSSCILLITSMQLYEGQNHSRRIVVADEDVVAVPIFLAGRDRATKFRGALPQYLSRVPPPGVCGPVVDFIRV